VSAATIDQDANAPQDQRRESDNRRTDATTPWRVALRAYVRASEEFAVGAIARRIAVVLLLAGLFAPHADAAIPETLVVQRGGIDAFAQEGGRIAWIGGPCYAVHVRTLSTGRQRVVGSAAGWGDIDCYAVDLVFALGGSRAVWGGYNDSSNHSYGGVKTGALGSRPRILDGLELTYYIWGEYLTDAAGDGSTLVYSLVSVDLANPDQDLDQCLPRCLWRVDGGAVKRVVGRTATRLPNARPSVAISASNGRVALVPADLSERRDPTPRSVSGGPVEIRDAVTGAPVTTFAPSGTVTDVALSGRRAAVLVESGDLKRIAIYDATTGSLRRSTNVPASTASEIDIAGRRVVFSTGRQVRLFSAATGGKRLLWTASARPIELSIEGRRVGWAENVRGGGRTTGRIRAISLP
jgi:hypothetical protein